MNAYFFVKFYWVSYAFCAFMPKSFCLCFTYVKCDFYSFLLFSGRFKRRCLPNVLLQSANAPHWNHLWRCSCPLWLCCCRAVVADGEAPPTTASKNHTELVNLEQMGDFPAEQTTPSGKGLIWQYGPPIRLSWKRSLHPNLWLQVCQCVFLFASINSHVSLCWLWQQRPQIKGQPISPSSWLPW